MFNVSGLDIVTKPGRTDVVLTVTASEEAIKPKGKPGKDAFKEDGLLTTFGGAFERYNIKFQLEIRGCVIGEAQLARGENFVCQKCTAGRFLLEKPKLEEEKRCKPCPADKAQCEGGSRIGPKAGFWRRNTTSDAFLQCPHETPEREQACLGLYRDTDGGEQLYSYTGFCGQGYYGALCSSCEPQYYRSGSYDCKKCADPTWNGLRIAGVFCLVFIVVVVLVKGTIASQTRKQAYSVFIKILLNHM